MLCLKDGFLRAVLMKVLAVDFQHRLSVPYRAA